MLLTALIKIIKTGKTRESSKPINRAIIGRIENNKK